MNVANNWEDYEILDMAEGEKLERWGNVLLIRPDPQIIWKQKTYPNKWKIGDILLLILTFITVFIIVRHISINTLMLLKMC